MTKPVPDASSTPAPKPKDYGATGLCSEAQADGVPCDELDRDCETCGHAVLDGEQAPVTVDAKTPR